MARRTVFQMLAEAKEQVEIATPPSVAEELKTGEVVLLDVRLPVEIARSGTIQGSVPVPRQVVEWWADPDSPYFRTGGVFGDFDQRMITFCDGGGNGVFAALTLQQLGYTNVATVEGGFYGWIAAGLPTTQPEAPS